jgi:hypothetical protein
MPRVFIICLHHLAAPLTLSALPIFLPCTETREGNIYSFCTSPGFFGTIRGIVKLINTIHPESPAAHLATTASVEQLLQALNPDLVVVDRFFEAARDAIIKLGAKHVILSPNTLKDIAGADQGLGVFKWPV